ncbi:MAG: hypothetical protein RR374_01420 [Clostridia bacterium]
MVRVHLSPPKLVHEVNKQKGAIPPKLVHEVNKQKGAIPPKLVHEVNKRKHIENCIMRK